MFILHQKQYQRKIKTKENQNRLSSTIEGAKENIK